MYTNQLIISFVTIGALYFLMNMKPKKKGQMQSKQQSYNNNYQGYQGYQGYPTINNQPIFNTPPNQQIPQNISSNNNPINENFSSYTNVSPEIKRNDTKTAKIALAFLTIGMLYLLYDQYS